MARVTQTATLSAPRKVENRLGRPGLFADLKAVLKKEFGPRFRGLVLYGSFARGEEGPESDVDVLVLLNGRVNVARDSDRAIDATFDVSLEIERVLSVLAVPAQDFANSGWSFYQTVRPEALWL
ncbi:MAG: nucleotidyltransferase domain-containing protein [Bdellovibrionota bacterium]